MIDLIASMTMKRILTIGKYIYPWGDWYAVWTGQYRDKLAAADMLKTTLIITKTNPLSPHIVLCHMSLTGWAIDWLFLLFWHKKENQTLSLVQAFKEGKQRPRFQLHASLTKRKKFQNDATTQKRWQGSKQAIGSSSSSSPRTTTIPHATSEPWESTNNNQKRTRHRKLGNGNFVNRAKALIRNYQILMIAQHLQHPLDSAISNILITLHSRAHNPCRTSSVWENALKTCIQSLRKEARGLKSWL